MIAVATGAMPTHARKSERGPGGFSTARVLMTQLEIPVETWRRPLNWLKGQV